MITEVSILPSPDGAILILLPPSGMDLEADTVFCAGDGRLRIGQAGQCYVDVAFDGIAEADLVLGNTDVSVAEVDDEGIRFHSRTREAKL